MTSSNVFYRGELKRPYPVMERAEGVYVYDSEGNEYLDAMSGVGVVNAGNVPEAVEAMTDQATRMPFCYTLRFTNRMQEDLAKRIAARSPEKLNKVWFSLTGAQANECAVKLARQYQVERGRHSKYKVVSRWQSYHGSSLGMLGLAGAEGWRRNYAPMIAQYPKVAPVNCYRCPFGKTYPSCDLECAHDLERVVKYTGANEICAFIAETVVAGTSGATVPPPEYYKVIRSICDKYDILFIVDEVFCGNGRTGKFYAIEHWDVVPDIIGIAKGIAGGYVPLAATVVHEKIYEAIRDGSGRFVHGVTFSGHPVACATALAVLDHMEENQLVKRAAEMGDYLFGKLSSLRESPIVGDVRGKGLLLAIEFVADRATKEPFDPRLEVAKKVAQAAFERGLLVQAVGNVADGTRGDLIMVCPPFILSTEEADRIVRVLADAFASVQRELLPDASQRTTQ